MEFDNLHEVLRSLYDEIVKSNRCSQTKFRYATSSVQTFCDRENFRCANDSHL